MLLAIFWLARFNPFRSFPKAYNMDEPFLEPWCAAVCDPPIWGPTVCVEQSNVWKAFASLDCVPGTGQRQTPVGFLGPRRPMPRILGPGKSSPDCAHRAVQVRTVRAPQWPCLPVSTSFVRGSRSSAEANADECPRVPTVCVGPHRVAMLRVPLNLCWPV